MKYELHKTLCKTVTPLREAKEDKDFAELRKTITQRKREINAHHAKLEKAYARASAELIVAELSWDFELERLIEIFQAMGRGKELERAFKDFNKNAVEQAHGLFIDDKDVFDDHIAESVWEKINRDIKKVKL